VMAVFSGVERELCPVMSGASLIGFTMTDAEPVSALKAVIPPFALTSACIPPVPKV